MSIETIKCEDELSLSLALSVSSLSLSLSLSESLSLSLSLSIDSTATEYLQKKERAWIKCCVATEPERPGPPASGPSRVTQSSVYGTGQT